MEAVTMSPAFGAYIRALRKRRGLSQVRLAEAIGVTGNTIWRIEAGRQEPMTPQLAVLLTTLGGRIRDVAHLIRHDATQAMAELLAEEALLEQALVAQADTDPKRAALLRRVARLTDDPAQRARIEGYIAALEQDPFLGA